mmetsp:Transcript_25505/g.61447  ORF Transcript_25505/g.61447 Transcript_25505/m.61447 type:complete len:83 (-) Transcript_25505:449-697(-)
MSTIPFHSSHQTMNIHSQLLHQCHHMSVHLRHERTLAVPEYDEHQEEKEQHESGGSTSSSERTDHIPECLNHTTNLPRCCGL